MTTRPRQMAEPRGSSAMIQEPPRLNPVEAIHLVRLLHAESGISVPPERVDFLRARLGRELRRLGCTSFADYLRHLSGPHGPAERRRMVEAMATHTTAFFREPAHFEWLARHGLPDFLAQGVGHLRPLRLWSAACSIGPEAWTAAMVLDRFGGGQGRGLRWQILGSDISKPVMKRAEAAVYTAEEIATIPEDWRRDYLLRARKPLDGYGWPLFRIAPELRIKARFSEANLLEPTTLPSGNFDVIFLRNVLIYLAVTDQRRALKTLVSKLNPGGVLITGHSDQLDAQGLGLTAIAASIHRKA